VGAAADRRRTWRSRVEVTCVLSRKTGKVIEANTLDLGPGGMRLHTNRPLGIDEVLEFKLPEHAKVSGRARVLREQAYRIYALRFEQLGEQARAEISALAAASPSAPAR
jgi:hypothetical protein